VGVFPAPPFGAFMLCLMLASGSLVVLQADPGDALRMRGARPRCAHSDCTRCWLFGTWSRCWQIRAMLGGERRKALVRSFRLCSVLAPGELTVADRSGPVRGRDLVLRICVEPGLSSGPWSFCRQTLGDVWEERCAAVFGASFFQNGLNARSAPLCS